MIQRIGLTGNAMQLELRRVYLGERLLGESGGAAGDPIVIEFTSEVMRTCGDNRLVIEAGRGRAMTARDESLVRAIACGRAWFEELANGRAASFSEIAARVGVTDRYVSRIVDLAFLAPDMVEAILSGEQKLRLTVKSLTVDGSVPVMWAAGSAL